MPEGLLLAIADSQEECPRVITLATYESTLFPPLDMHVQKTAL